MRRRRDFDDLIGEVEDEELSFNVKDVHLVSGGVSVQWLAKAFRTTRYMVEKKLLGVQPVTSGKHGNPMYDLPEAAAYLVDPRVDIEKYITTIKPENLPEKLRESYWNSMLKRQRWEERAGHLWRTELVLERFSEVLMDIRTKLQLIPDRIERNVGLSDEQHRVVRQVLDDIQNEMHEKLVEYSGGRITPNQLGEMQAAEEEDLI